MNKSSERFLLYCLIRFFIIIIYLSIFSNMEMVLSGWVWLLMLFILFIVSSGWIVFYAAKIIETKPEKSMNLMIASIGVDLVISYFLLDGKLVYAIPGIIALIIVFRQQLRWFQSPD